MDMVTSLNCRDPNVWGRLFIVTPKRTIISKSDHVCVYIYVYVYENIHLLLVVFICIFRCIIFTYCLYIVVTDVTKYWAEQGFFLVRSQQRGFLLGR